MFIDKLLPITFKGWDVLNKANDLIFYDVHFTSEFGPWRNDEYCYAIQFLMSEARIVEITHANVVRISADIALTFIPAKPKQAPALTETQQIQV